MAKDTTPPIADTADAEAAANATVTARAAQAAHQAIDQLSARGSEAELRLRQTGTRLSSRSQELSKDIGEYVTQNPLTALGIAAAAGFVLGVLLRR